MVEDVISLRPIQRKDPLSLALLHLDILYLTQQASALAPAPSHWSSSPAVEPAGLQCRFHGAAIGDVVNATRGLWYPSTG
jgi:hypothetical protein